MVDIISFDPKILQLLPPETSAGILTLINILRTAGIVLIIYLIFQITNIVMNIKRNKRIKRIEDKTTSIENKINRLLNKNKTKK